MRGHGAHFNFDIHIAPIDAPVVVHRTRAARARTVHIDCKIARTAARCRSAFRRRAVGFVFRRRIGHSRCRRRSRADYCADCRQYNQYGKTK